MLLHFGSVPVLVVSSADAAKEIMKTHDLIFSNRPKTVGGRLFYNCKSVSFAPYGEYWRQVKNICVTRLLTSARVHSFRNVREEEVDLLIQNIRESCSQVVNLSDLFISLTNDIVSRIVLGRKYSIGTSIEGGGKSKIKELMCELNEFMGVFSVQDYIPRLSWVDRISGLKHKEEKLIEKLDDFMEGIVKDHMSISDDHRNNNFGTDQGQDFVDILLEYQKQSTSITGFPIDREAIKAVTLGVYEGGLDSAATILEWTMAELIRKPNIMLKLQAEVREIGKDKSRITEEDLKKMNYLKAVIKEILRLNTLAPLLIPRVSRQDVKVMGYDIAAGTQVIINAWAIARDPSFWADEPEEFRPERFLNSKIDFKGLHFEFLPFGAGRRGCPGIHFAMVIIEIALANLVHKFDFALPAGKRNEDLNMDGITGITLQKKSPLLVVATPSRSY